MISSGRWVMVLCLIAGGSALVQADEIPEGHEGIAGRYPGDVGIAADPAVILVEDFEDELTMVPWMEDDGWFGMKLGDKIRLSETMPVAGSGCLEFDLPEGKRNSGGGMFHKIDPTETVYYRYYRRFEEAWAWPDGYGPHDAMVFGGRFESPTHTDLNVYCDFWRGGHTVMRFRSRLNEDLEGIHNQWLDETWEIFGKPPVGGGAIAWNVARPDPIAPGEWHCCEFMVRLSTPGKADGTLRLWVNGKLVTNLEDVELRMEGRGDVKVWLVFLAPYFHPGSPKDQRHWADQIVIAREYIGPVKGVGDDGRW